MQEKDQRWFFLLYLYLYKLLVILLMEVYQLGEELYLVLNSDFCYKVCGFPLLSQSELLWRNISIDIVLSAAWIEL